MAKAILNWDAAPEIFWITDTLPVGYYGVLFALGLILGYLVVKYIFQKENTPLFYLDTMLVYITVGTLLGARLGHCLFYEPGYFLSHPLEIFLPIEEINGSYHFTGFRGLASHGGALGVLIAIVLFCRKYKVPFLWMMDRVAIGTPVAAAFIRLGNFMNSEIYGMPTNGNWGVVFMRDDLVPRHPTQLYEAFSYLTTFAVLLLLYKRNVAQKYSGVLFGYFLLLMFLARFIIEFFKENQEAFENSMLLNMGQLLSIPFILAGIVLIAVKPQPQPWFKHETDISKAIAHDR